MRYIKGLFCTAAFIVISVTSSLACTVTTVPVVFGDYDRMNPAPLDGTGSIELICPAGAPYTVRVGQGQYSGGSFEPRRMNRTGGGFTIDYNLFRDPARTQILGDGTGISLIITGTGTGTPESLTVYGRVFPFQNVGMGTYSDAVNVTVEW